MCQNKRKTKLNNVFQLFKIELKNRFELDKLVNCQTNVFVQKVIDLIQIHYRILFFFYYSNWEAYLCPLIFSNKSIVMWMYMCVCKCMNVYVCMCVYMYVYVNVQEDMFGSVCNVSCNNVAPVTNLCLALRVSEHLGFYYQN